MDEVFASTTAFNQDIGDWDVSSLVDMDGMFTGASICDQDISGWDVSSVIKCVDFASNTLSEWTTAEKPNFTCNTQ